MSGLEQKAENSGSIGWVRTALVGNVFPDVRYGDFKQIAAARKAIRAIRKEVYSTKHLDEVWENLNTEEHRRGILERSPLAAEWRAWNAAGRVDKKLEAKLLKELNKELNKEYRERLAAEIAEGSKEHLAVIKKYSTIDAADLHQDSAERDRLREQLKPRLRRVLAWILALSAIFLPLIILGPILYGIAFPSFIAGLGFGFAAVFGVAAAATPAGWALLSLVIAAVAILGVIGIVRIGFELAAKFNWGGRLALTPYQSMLAMITPREKSALNVAGQVEMVSQQHLTTGEESEFGLRPILNSVAAVSVGLSQQSAVVPPRDQAATAASTASNQRAVTVITAAPRAEVTPTPTPGKSLEGCLNQMREHLKEQLAGIEGVDQGTKLFLIQNIKRAEDHAKNNAGNLAYVVAQLTDFQQALSEKKIAPNTGLKRDFDAVIIAMLRSPSAGELFKPGCIEQFSKMLRKEHLDGLNAGELGKLSEQLKQGSKPDQSVEVTRAVQVVKGLLDTAVEKRPESRFESKA